MLSIIIPAKNEEAVIGTTIRALSTHLILPYEIIISDGASSDATVARAREAGAVVVEYTGEKRQTIAAGRNAGARASKGDILMFIDADSVFLDPQAFCENAVALFEKDPSLVAVAPQVRVLPAYATLADRIVFACVNKTIWFQNNILGRGAAVGECQIMRRDAFVRVGGYREELAVSEDLDLFLRLGRAGKTRFVSSLTVYHSGRRAHKIGWPKLLWQWMSNSFFYMVRDQPLSKEWEEVR